ncbi:MAG: hypothetical protein LBV44_03870 [Methylobacillus sp.]|jgi:type IV pilus assembly protein PilW|nr:hypothetical protein [Methylobacillus sp.]
MGIRSLNSKARLHGRGVTRQRGVTLIDLMVGIVIGLLIVAVCVAALMISRGTSGTITDAAGLAQQGAYAMRTLGSQLRQAGSLYLNPNPKNDADPFLARAQFEFPEDAGTPATADQMLSGTPTTLTTGFSNYYPAGSLFSANTDQLTANCVGTSPTAANDLIQSIFELDAATHELKCKAAGGAAQVVVRNVANFRLRYLVQTFPAARQPKIAYVTDTAGWTDANWAQVQGVEVCLELYGNEVTTVPSGSTYIGCDGTAIDMTTVMHMTFRSVFQLRSRSTL